MKLFTLFKQMCTPAQIYFVISFLSILSMMMQNIQDPHSYCCGLVRAQSPVNNIVYFIFKVMYVFVWTYLLNLLCKKGYKTMFKILGNFIITINRHVYFSRFSFNFSPKTLNL